MTRMKIGNHNTNLIKTLFMHKQIRDFFEQHILPLHQKAKEGKMFLEIGSDASKETYFTPPKHPDYLYLTKIPLEDKSALEAYLNEFWKDDKDLLKLIPDLVTLAFKLKNENKEQTAELSPFVYTMF